MEQSAEQEMLDTCMKRLLETREAVAMLQRKVGREPQEVGRGLALAQTKLEEAFHRLRDVQEVIP